MTAGERRAALIFWVQRVQTERFKLLRTTGRLQGTVQKLKLLIDGEGLLRVGGRLCNSKLPYSARHGLLLHKDGILTQLIVSDRYITISHTGCTALLVILQREFWILSAVIFKSMPCYRLKATTMQHIMGDLPDDRVSVIRPLHSVGTDFAGPFIVMASHLRSAKSYKVYLSVFDCLATKAVHFRVNIFA